MKLYIVVHYDINHQFIDLIESVWTNRKAARAALQLHAALTGGILASYDIMIREVDKMKK